MPTHPYIHFQGQCAAAMTAYAQIFGSAPPQLMRYADGPGASDGFKASERIMHGQVALFDGTLMGSDYPPGMQGDPQMGFSAMQSAPDFDTGARIFGELAEGGTGFMPLAPTFWSPAVGMLRDRWGITWMITVAPQS